MKKKEKKVEANEMDDLITQTEAARMRGISLPSINELVRRGRLRSKEVFGKKLVYRSEVESFEKEKPGPKTS
jgi:DNA-directed RNA polymerase specialized sigma24 family protein